MALNAFHIRAHSKSSVLGGGIGFRAPDHPSTSDADGWATLRTGEPSSASSLRTRVRFVKETSLSNPSLTQIKESEPASPTLEHAPVPDTRAEPSSEGSSFSQFYASLSRNEPAQETVVMHTHKRAPDQLHAKATQHSHHHRHDPTARHKSDWFVSKALAKLRHTQHCDKGKQRQVDPIALSTALCPSCGDALPADRSPEAMAQHRQSITHRLGLNAPMSSASASEAPSSAPSEVPTPLHRSRSASPDRFSAQAARPRSVSRRRLSTAARWKKIQQDNVGYTLLSRMGWKEGMGLGVDEWKWQQLCKEKKRQKLDQVSALLKVSAHASGQSAEDGISIHEDDSPLSAKLYAHSPSEWLQLLPQAPPETADDYRFGDDSLLLSDDDMHNLIIESLPLEERLALQQAIQAGDVRLSDLLVTIPQQANDGVLIEPIDVDVRPDRRGLGNETHRRRSRNSDGAVEIRQPAIQNEALCKKTKASSNPSQYLRPRSRSTKHQRKLAEERKKRDWLDLRASLS